MKIAIIGAGNMGKAINNRLAPTHQTFLYDRNTALQEAIETAEIVILAVKPQNLKEITLKLKSSQLLVSLLAGTPLSVLKRFFPSSPIVRMMPNLPLVHGEGVIALSTTATLNREELTNLFSPLGKVYWMEDDKIEALSSLAGSGPAFVFSIVEAMIEAGNKMGLENSQDLVYQMLRGSLTLLENKTPQELIHQVASRGGTTREGLNVWDNLHLRKGIEEMFFAAYGKAKQFSASWDA